MTTVTTTVHEPLDFAVIATGLGFPEGPVVCDDGTVLVVDIDGGRVVRVDGGTTTVVATPGGGPNGMALGGDGDAYVANNGGFLWTEVNGVRIPIDHPTHTNEPPGFAGGWIERVDLSSGQATVLHDSCDGRRLRGPNDLAFDEVGGLWFTDHGKGRLGSVDRGGLYYVPPAVAGGRPRLRGRDPHRPPVGVGPGGSRRGAPGGGLPRRPPRRDVRGGHALLVRLVGRRGGRADRDRRHR